MTPIFASSANSKAQKLSQAAVYGCQTPMCGVPSFLEGYEAVSFVIQVD